MAQVDPFVDGQQAPPVSPAQASGWYKYRLKTRAAVASDTYWRGLQNAAQEGRYQQGLASFWGVRPGPKTVGSWQSSHDEAADRWNDEFDQHPDRMRNADKWLRGSREGIQR